MIASPGKTQLGALILALLLTGATGGNGAAQTQAGQDERPYDAQLLRLSEILGAIHYLRELCGTDEGQIWREQMNEILRTEGTSAIRRAQLVRTFNQGYRGYSRTYRSCNESARVAIDRFMDEGARLANLLARESR